MRIYCTASTVVFCVRGCAAMMMALRPFKVNKVLSGGVASGPVVGMRAATTPTGFAILINPFSGSSSTTPTARRNRGRTPPVHSEDR